MSSALPVIERFMKFVEPVTESGCWIWMGSTFKKKGGAEYGQFQMPTGKSGGKPVQAHRLSFLLHKGEIPQGHFIDHECRVKLCVNPAHIRAVTPQVNVLENNDSVCSLNARKTHCLRGHEFTPKNTKLVPGGRSCNECRRIRRRRYWKLKGV